MTSGTIRALVVLSLTGLWGISPAAAQQDLHADHLMASDQTTSASTTAVVSTDERLPPGDAQAKDALNKSPRHGEWASVKLEGSEKPLVTWVVYPERKEKAPVVIVIHEIFGLTDWIRGVADQLAEDGFIAVAPDLLSGQGPGGGNTDAFASRDDVTKAIRSLTPDDVTGRLNAVREYAITLPAANGKSATVGFCWGGSTSFAYATAQPGLNAAIVYYGSAPDAARLATIKAPVLGLYGGDDARVNATIPPTETEMKKLGKSYEPHIYDGAGHGFLRAQDGKDGANLKATQQAWPRTVAFLRQYTK
ncbi:MAG: dienelactone hydrolase family protein [Candidatus Latescibacteria bacterium]|nr:dienelactone hydrolase family protein [Candidatus Latescibacterota bacterium]